MKLVIRLLVTAIIVVLLSYILPGVDVDSYWSAIIVAIVLALLNLVVKPLLVLFTLPVTILTLGLFLLVINALIIMLCDYLIDGFTVSGFWYALLFSVLLSFVQSITNSSMDQQLYFFFTRSIIFCLQFLRFIPIKLIFR